MNYFSKWSSIRAFVLAVITATALVSAPASAANEMHTLVLIDNGTGHDAWVDISWAYNNTGWNMEKAFCLRPGESTHHVTVYHNRGPDPQIRVRAEIKHGDCRSGNIREVSANEKISKSNPSIRADIQGHGGYYNIRLHIR